MDLVLDWIAYTVWFNRRDISSVVCIWISVLDEIRLIVDQGGVD